MGIHADAVAMAELTGKSVKECKKARKAHDPEIGELARAGKKTLESMTEVCFDDAQPVAPAKTEKQVQDPTPDSQVSVSGVFEKEVTAPPPPVIETFDEEVIPLQQESTSAFDAEVQKMKGRGKSKSKAKGKGYGKSLK